MRRRDNRGASFVLVVIAMAIVAILAVTVLWISLVNMQMKVTNKKNTDNFYSAEGVLDQICTGLQGDVSNAYKTGYSSVLENYTAQSESDRQKTFTEKYVETLRNALAVGTTVGSEYTYDIEKLRGYVDKSLIEPKSKPHADITTTSSKDGSDNGTLAVYGNRVVIKGIKVKYTDSEGYESIIETDISLDVPSMKFSASGAVPELFAYSLIGNTGVIIANDHGTNVDLDGNLYAGSPHVIDVSDSDTTSVSIPNNIKLNVDKTSYFIAEGDLNVGASKANTSSGSNLTVSQQCQLWSDNIYVKGADALLHGNTYVADDLTLKGLGSHVELGKDGKGRYVGFGNKNDVADGIAGNSSAIIINGKNSSIDMSQLDELMVAGYAYINTSSITGTLNGEQNKNVGTGESVSVKGNQIAYLVPAECIGTEGNGADAKSAYNKNPLSYSEYKEITGADGKKKYSEVNINVASSKIGASLSKYMSEGDISSYIRKVFVPSSGSDSNDGLVYYYVNLPGDKASQYYEDYFNQDKNAEAKLLKYTNFYTKSIKVSSDSASIYTAGKYSVFDMVGDQKELSIHQGKTSDINLESSSLQNTYTALTSKLITDYSLLEGSEASNILFKNLIDEDKVNSLLSKAGADEFTFETEVDGKTYHAVVTNADTYTFDGTYSDSSKNKNNNISLIVTTGNVNVKADFKGTIIAKGKINIEKNSNNIGNSTQDIFRALLLEKVSDADDAMHLYDVFVNGKAYLGDDAKDVDDLDYTKLITYENWTKK